MNNAPEYSKRRRQKLPPDKLKTEETFTSIKIIKGDKHPTKSVERVEVDVVDELPLFESESQKPVRSMGLVIMSIACAELIAFGTRLLLYTQGTHDIMVWGLLGLFWFAVTVTFALIFFWGLKLIDLPKEFMRYLCTITIAELAAMLVLLMKALW